MKHLYIKELCGGYLIESFRGKEYVRITIQDTLELVGEILGDGEK